MEDVGYKKLLVWKRADEFAYEAYLASKNFPRSELFGLTAQLRRACLSVPTNLAEGCGRQSKRELKQFVNIAMGSHFETEYLLSFCLKLGYVEKNNFERLEALRREVGSLLWRFYKSL